MVETVYAESAFWLDVFAGVGVKNIWIVRDYSPADGPAQILDSPTAISRRSCEWHPESRLDKEPLRWRSSHLLRQEPHLRASALARRIGDRGRRLLSAGDGRRMFRRSRHHIGSGQPCVKWALEQQVPVRLAQLEDCESHLQMLAELRKVVAVPTASARLSHPWIPVELR